MSMYGMVFGKSQDSEVLLKCLGLSQNDFYRFRDCYLSESGSIAVYTRGGGGNRECWGGDCRVDNHIPECVISSQEKLRKHPCYLSDADDEFDETYATFYFSVPDAKQIDGIAPEMSRNEAWLKFIDALQKSAAPPSKAEGRE